MRILLAIGSAHRGGAEGQLTGLACRLKASGHDVRVLFLTQGGPLTAALDEGGVPWTVARPVGVPTSIGRNAAMFVRLAILLWSWRPHVLYSWLAGAIWPTFLFARPLRRTARVAAFRGEVFPTRFRIGTQMFRWAVRSAHAVTINAPQLREHALTWGAKAERVHFVPNGVTIPEWRSDPSTVPPTAVVVANFRWYKGHDVLADALARVTSPVSVRLRGEGDHRDKTREALADLGILHKVVFVDHPADVQAELRRAQFGIHPSRTEGLSNAILEELAAGLPVVATDVGGTSLLIESGVNGLLVPSSEPQALAEAIATMADQHSKRVAMAEEARRMVHSFSWEASAKRTEQVLRTAARVTRGLG
jgi:L-malate glycosyltransferase